mmetsp:Transcript_42021/g.107462  ORF Transcript_42021/g.107462 Transcript_42021/m.107462 type:complete len:83 (-) Transcript_42021:20-268(-)
MDGSGKKPEIQEVLPKAGLVVSEKGNLAEILCKPKIMPLKSITLEKLEEMEKRLAEANAQAATGDGAAGMTFGSAQMEMERP